MQERSKENEEETVKTEELVEKKAAQQNKNLLEELIGFYNRVLQKINFRLWKYTYLHTV